MLVLWVPDWPIHAHRLEHADREPADDATALVARQVVIACSPAARAQGVRAGIRVREAQVRCPGLHVQAHEPEVDERRFAEVLLAIEQLIPDAAALRPGLAALRARGPARFYGSEELAGSALIALAEELGLPETRVGIAPGRFAAEQAARATPDTPGVLVPARGVRRVPSSATAEFLSTLPVARATGSELAEVMLGLGITTLGALAALPEDAVRQRFGAAGVSAHRRASGSEEPIGITRRRLPLPARELSVCADLEPPLDGADRLAFTCSVHAESFIDGLTEHRLVCTELRIELTDDLGRQHERNWAHPTHFTAADVVNRLRWQVASLPSDAERSGAGIARVRLVPRGSETASSHEAGLWNAAPDARVHHHLSRVQSLLGHEAVGTAELTGGRRLAERQRFVPWGTRPERKGTSHEGAWPGHLRAVAPNLVFSEPLPVEFTDATGATVRIDADDLLLAPPQSLRLAHARRAEQIVAWSPPWPLRERWWAGEPSRFRIQVLLEDGHAWVLIGRPRGAGAPREPPPSAPAREPPAGASPVPVPAHTPAQAHSLDMAWHAEGRYA